MQDPDLSNRLPGDRIPAILQTTDLAGRLSRVSERWLQWLGYDRATVIGTDATRYMTEESARHFLGLLSSLRATSPEFADVPIRFVDQGDEVRETLLSMVRWDDAGPEQGLVTAAIVDVTALQLAEQDALDARQREQEALLRSSREIDSLARIAAHDLQTPLRHIESFSRVIASHQGASLDEEGKLNLGYVAESAARMKAMLRELVLYARVNSNLAVEQVDIGAIIRSIVNKLSRDSEGDALAVVADDLPKVFGGSAQLRQLFEILLGNAQKFRSDRPPRAEIQVAPTHRHGWSELSVTDNGIGIDPRYAGEVFEIFRRLHAKSAYSGSGIGLAICRRIVEGHGGQIWLDTAYDGPGTRFRLTLPVEPTSAPLEEGSTPDIARS